jgi:hypothetical protein
MATLKKVIPAISTLPTRVHAYPPGSAHRHMAEQFVHAAFKRHYQADIQSFMPMLLSLSDEQQRLHAVLGFRHANATPLFLEKYLDQPVEQLLASRIHAPVDRSRLLEVGNLAVSASGGGRWLITALTAYLSTTHSEWVLFTIGPVLRNVFSRLGLELIDLAEARKDRLPLEEQAAWGSYYDQKPHVMAGKIATGYSALLSLCEQEGELMNLWQQAIAVGREAA